MAEPEREPTEAGERLTRDDVLRLIEEHGGPEGLDLRAVDLREADLTGLDLHAADLRNATLDGANLRKANLEGADLSQANFREADLRQANLQRVNLYEADLRSAQLSSANFQESYLLQTDLRGAWLDNAKLEGAHLVQADLRGAYLAGARLRGMILEGVNWGDYVLGDEIDGQLWWAALGYTALKQWHTEAGMYDIAGEFHYREMEARRKLAQQKLPWKQRRLPYALALYALRFLYGYGERPERVIGWAAAVVFGLAFVHWSFGTVAGGFLDALYFSAVSFTALGYGASDSDPQGWAGRFLGAGESFLGVFMMALFLVTFTRKMTR